MAENYNFDDHFINLASFKKGFNELNALMGNSMQELQEYINVMNQLLKIEKSRQAEIRKSAKVLQQETIANEKALKSDTNALKQNTDAMRKYAKESEESAKQIAELKKRLKAATDALKEQSDEKKESNEIDEKTQKLKAKLASLDDESIKKNILLNEQIKQKAKALREEAKASITNYNAYQKLAKQRNEAQKQLQNLVALHGEHSKEVREAAKAFAPLNERFERANEIAKNGFVFVGRYERALKGLKKQAKSTGQSLKEGLTIGAASAAVGKLMEGFSGALNSNSQAAGAFEKVLGAITITFSVLVSRFIKAIPLIKESFTSFFDSVSNGWDSFGLKAEKAFLKATNAFGRNDDEIKKLDESILKLQKNGSETGDSWDKLVKIFEGGGDEIAKLVEKNNNLVDTTLAYRKQIIGLQNELNALLPTQSKLQAASDNENNSLQDRIKSQQDLILETEKINDLEEQIIKKREFLARENARINNQNIEAQEEAASATAERVALQIQNEQELADQKRELATLERDQIEQNLDFLIDDFDNRKTINERNIANEKLTYKERNDLLLENQKLAEESYKAQTDELSKRLTEQGKAQIDFDKLVKESSSERIAQIVRDAGLDETLNTRVLEIIRERRIVLQDLKDTQDELNKSNQDGFELIEDNILLERTLLELQKDGVDTEKVLEKLEEQRLEKKIQNLQLEISLSEESSAKELKLKKELNEALLQQTTNRIKSESELEQKQFEQRRSIQKGVVDLFIDSENKRIDKIKDAKKQERERYLLLVKQFVLEQALNKLRARLGDQSATQDLNANKNAFLTSAIGGLGSLLGGFKDGGYTGLGYNFRDYTGDRVAGVVHEKEYVVPKNVLGNTMASQMVSSLEMFRKTKNEKHLLAIPQKQISKALESKLVQKQTIVQNNFNAKEIAQELSKVLPKQDIQETANGVLVRQKVGNIEREYLVNAKKSIIPKF